MGGWALVELVAVGWTGVAVVCVQFEEEGLEGLSDFETGGRCACAREKEARKRDCSRLVFSTELLFDLIVGGLSLSSFRDVTGWGRPVLYITILDGVYERKEGKGRSYSITGFAMCNGAMTNERLSNLIRVPHFRPQFWTFFVKVSEKHTVFPGLRPMTQDSTRVITS